MSQSALDLLVCFDDLLIGERAVEGLVGQGERKALGAHRDSLARVQIE